MTDSHIRVLLVEQEPETISVVSLFLSEIKECSLRISSSGEEALLIAPDYEPDLILFAHGMMGRDSLDVLKELHKKFHSTYLIVSVPSESRSLIHTLLAAGAYDCICKDVNYVANLIQAVKKAFIRIAERETYAVPSMGPASCFAIDENLPDLVFMLDLQGMILYTNAAVRHVLGYEQKEMIGCKFPDLFASDNSRSRFEAYLSDADYRINFRDSVRLTAKEEQGYEFRLDCTLVEGETIYGIAKKKDVPEFIDVLDELPTDSSEMIPPQMDHYRIVTILGAGAMGRVYKGFDENLERFVAIKVLNKALASDEEALLRFLQEARILASISHPSIAPIYHFGERDSLPFFCMEYLPGGSLEDILRRTGSIDPDEALSYVQQVAMALNEASRRGVLHMDVKPSNIMISENQRVKVVDFGLASRNIATVNHSEYIVGTPGYIAPEQIESGLADKRSDIYSLGISFFHMLYGFVPFYGENLEETFRKCMKEDFPSRDSLDPTVPAEFYDIIRRMTARDPSERYQDYPELINDLERISGCTGGVTMAAIPASSPVSPVLQGKLYDRPLPEILSEIALRELSGTLTLIWMDIRKAIHFCDGNIIAVLSNQEGENFTDVLQKRNYLTAKSSKAIRGASADLYVQYSNSMNCLDENARKEAAKTQAGLAMRILQGLFRWGVGDFSFEECTVPGQLDLHFSAYSLILQGVKEWIPPETLERRIHDGNCRIHLQPDYESVLLKIQITPADAFLLFRFEDTITFEELFLMSGLSENEFHRLIYLYSCLKVVRLYPLEDVATGHSIATLAC